MKRFFFFLWICLPLLAMAQGQKGEVSECAPMRGGKVCYLDTVKVTGVNQQVLFKAIEHWAKKKYGRDVFLSNVTTDPNNGEIRISSSIELLLNETDKTTLKYRMKIRCHDDSYTAEVTRLTYQYDPKNEKKFKTYPAEKVIANNGKDNKIALIKDPKLFCNATFFFVENLFGEIFNTANSMN